MTATVHRDHKSGRHQRLQCTDGETEAQRSNVDTSATLFLCSAASAARSSSRGLRTRASIPCASAAHAHWAGRERSWACVGVCARAAGARTTAVGSVRALTCRAPCWRAGGSGSGRFSLCPSRSVSRFPPPRLPSGPPSPVAGVWRSVCEGGGGRPGGAGAGAAAPGTAAEGGAGGEGLRGAMDVERLQEVLKDFEKRGKKEVCPVLDQFLCHVAKTGETMIQWSQFKGYFIFKLEKVMDDFRTSAPEPRGPPNPNVEYIPFDEMKERILKIVTGFNGYAHNNSSNN